MGTRRYYFPKYAKGHPMRHLAMTSEMLIGQNDHIAEIFQKYAAKSYPQSPRHILFLMSRHTESLFESKEGEGTSLGIKSSSSRFSESSSPVKRFPSLSSLKKKLLSFDDSAQSSKTDKNKGSPISKGTETVLISHEGPVEMAVIPELISPIKDAKKNDNPTTYAQVSSPSEKDKVPEIPDSGCHKKEFKRPAVQIKDEDEASNPAKRPKLSDSSVTNISEFGTSGEKAETPIHTSEDDKMDISPIKGDKPSKADDAKMDTCSTKGEKTTDSPNKGGKVIASSPGKSKSLKKMELLVIAIPIMKDKEIEIDMSVVSKENTSCASKVPSADYRDETAIDNLDAETLRIEDLVKEVDRRIKADLSLTKPERVFSPTKKKASKHSPRKSGKFSSPDKDIEKISGFHDPESNCSHPNVLAYLKMRFSKILSHRTKYMTQIQNSFTDFKGDVAVLFYYARIVSVVVDGIPIEDKEHFIEDLKNLRDDLIKNTKKLSKNMLSMINTVKADIPFWDRGLQEFQNLKNANEPLLSAESNSLELLREYESNMKRIWDKMDRRIFLRNGLRSTLLDMSVDFVKLAKDFVRYLVMVEILRPSLMVSSEEAKEK